MSQKTSQSCTDYLLTKLAEEAGELVVAALKHSLHDAPRTRRDLRNEAGDVLALIGLLIKAEVLSAKEVNEAAERRSCREKERCKNR
jgi:NTP pyrophosphatase (non-canonical NTP hydrolase)